MNKNLLFFYLSFINVFSSALYFKYPLNEEQHQKSFAIIDSLSTQRLDIFKRTDVKKYNQNKDFFRDLTLYVENRDSLREKKEFHEINILKGVFIDNTLSQFGLNKSYFNLKLIDDQCERNIQYKINNLTQKIIDLSDNLEDQNYKKNIIKYEKKIRSLFINILKNKYLNEYQRRSLFEDFSNVFKPFYNIALILFKKKIHVFFTSYFIIVR